MTSQQILFLCKESAEIGRRLNAGAVIRPVEIEAMQAQFLGEIAFQLAVQNERNAANDQAVRPGPPPPHIHEWRSLGVEGVWTCSYGCVATGMKEMPDTAMPEWKPVEPFVTPGTPQESRESRLEAQLIRNRQGLVNILEMRKLDTRIWGDRHGYGGRYGALTREEIEGVIADIDKALGTANVNPTAEPMSPEAK